MVISMRTMKTIVRSNMENGTANVQSANHDMFVPCAKGNGRVFAHKIISFKNSKDHEKA